MRSGSPPEDCNDEAPESVKDQENQAATGPLH
jgi:hypothetical protein